jgi:pantothenate kinase
MKRYVDSLLQDSLGRHKLMPCSWFVSVPREAAKKRLMNRHVMAGIESTIEGAAARTEENDLLNRDLIIRNMISPDFVIKSLDLEE